MARPLVMAHPENTTIEELKHISRVGSNETATRYSAIQMLLAGVDRKLVCKTEEKLLGKRYKIGEAKPCNPKNWLTSIWIFRLAGSD